MSDEFMARVIDCDRNVGPSAQAIRAAGYQTVIRYYSRQGGQWCGKTLVKDELTALDAAELSVAIVFQYNNDQADHFYDPQKKIDDVAAALGHAQHLEQPEQTPIYFGVDFNINTRRKKDASGHFYKDAHGDWVVESSTAIQDINEKAVYDYFEYAHAQLGEKGYQVGVYGCGRVAELLGGFADKPRVADYFWLSASVSYVRTADFYNTNKWHLFQCKTDIPSHLIPDMCHDDVGRHQAYDEDDRKIDFDVLNDQVEYFGQWRKDGSKPPHPSAASKLILKNRAFATASSASIFKDADDQSRVVGKVLYGRNVRLLERRVDGFVGVSIDESDSVLGYCRKADLTDDLTSMPLWT